MKREEKVNEIRQLSKYDKPARETVLSVYHDSLALLTVHDIKDFLELHHQLKLRNRVIPISSPSRSRISVINPFLKEFRVDIEN
ncbi:hypothetical protein NC651_036191 [Populus alba x Populus x berolinensis]|nr:hypothetical protein NC651_036191 [Populus alba x Populus x berolinensis]